MLSSYLLPTWTLDTLAFLLLTSQMDSLGFTYVYMPLLLPCKATQYGLSVSSLLFQCKSMQRALLSNDFKCTVTQCNTRPHRMWLSYHSALWVATIHSHLLQCNPAFCHQCGGGACLSVGFQLWLHCCECGGGEPLFFFAPQLFLFPLLSTLSHFHRLGWWNSVCNADGNPDRWFEPAHNGVSAQLPFVVRQHYEEEDEALPALFWMCKLCWLAMMQDP